MLKWLKTFSVKALQGLLIAITKIIWRELWEIAIDVVGQLKDKNLADNAKRQEAFDAIKEIGKARGIEYKNNWVNLVIEIAVLAIKTVVK